MRSRTSGGASASSPPDTGTCGSARASRSSRAGGTCRSCSRIMPSSSSISTTGAGRSARDYTVMIYQKGAWVLQMLRNLMLDLRTMKEDAFSAMMQDFYEEYRGKRATTRDFQRVVE